MLTVNCKHFHAECTLAISLSPKLLHAISPIQFSMGQSRCVLLDVENHVCSSTTKFSMKLQTFGVCFVISSLMKLPLRLLHKSLYCCMVKTLMYSVIFECQLVGWAFTANRAYIESQLQSLNRIRPQTSGIILRLNSLGEFLFPSLLFKNVMA